MTDMVNHPPHYKGHPSGVECRRIAEHWGFYKGNIIKYLYRWKDKGNPVENIEKALKYVDFDIEAWEGVLPEFTAVVNAEENPLIRASLRRLLFNEYEGLLVTRGHLLSLRASILQEDVASEPAAE